VALGASAGRDAAAGVRQRPGFVCWEKEIMLAKDSRTMTEFDVRRLDALFERMRDQVRPPATLTFLERELAEATVVESHEVPATVVTMNSEVEVKDVETEERRCLTLVFPSMVGTDAGRVSVLAPLGTALIGAREGALVCWSTPRGQRQLQVERIVYQPEAAGRFDL
jgi:regulator of nucleoside diphosphate kinase